MMRNLMILMLLVAGCTAAAQNTVSSAGTFLDLGGVKLWYQECGAANATSVVLLHDGLLHSITWDGVWEPLCAKYHVVRYDRRGYGRSEPSKALFVPEDDLAKIMQQVHMQYAIFVGNSSGGGLAIDFALAHPESVSALFLIGTVVHGMPTSNVVNERGARNSAPMQKDDVRATAENWSKDRYLIAGDDPAARKQIYGSFAEPAESEVQQRAGDPPVTAAAHSAVADPRAHAATGRRR